MKMKMMIAMILAGGMGVGLAGAADEVGGKGHVHLPLGVMAPEILATSMDGRLVTLESLRGKPVVMEFGSITEPLFRLRVATVEKLAAGYGDKVTFLLVYGKESHAADTADAIEENGQEGFDIANPVSQAERLKVAQQAIDRLKIVNEKVAVDAWNNTSVLRYGNTPNMTFVIDAAGKLQAGYPWMDPKKVQGAVDSLLAGQTVPAGLRGPVQGGSAANTDYASAAMEMTGNGPGAKLALVLDNLNMTDAQKAGIYPALSEFLSDRRTLRGVLGGPAGNAAGAGGKAGAKAGAGAAGGVGGASANGDEKPITPEELEGNLMKMREDVVRLKAVMQTYLSASQVQQVLDVLDNGPGRRMLGNN
jgi:hypothetical protein